MPGKESILPTHLSPATVNEKPTRVPLKSAQLTPKPNKLSMEDGTGWKWIYTYCLKISILTLDLKWQERGQEGIVEEVIGDST